LGRALLALLDDATLTSRRAKRMPGVSKDVLTHIWDPIAEPMPANALHNVDTIFSLAGEPVATGRWTAAKKKRIEESRVIGTRNLVKGIAASKHRPRVLVAASAVGFYGDRGDQVLDESATEGSDFLAQVCRGWEREAMAAEELGVRVVCVRIGVVLSPKGGALERMLPIFSLGAGGRLGTGKQWMSWIHIEDLANLLIHVATDEHIHGPVNGVAPEAVTNLEFTATLAKTLNRPAVFAVPSMALRFALGEMSGMLLASQRVRPVVAEQTKYKFKHPELNGALFDLLCPHNTPPTTKENL